MSSSTPELVKRLLPEASRQLNRILSHRRETFWGDTPIYFRIRTHPKSHESQVTVVKPLLNKVKLFSLTLRKKVEVECTPQVLRHIEGLGGLDEYLLKTPDRELNSDVASKLRWDIMQARKQQKQMQAGPQPATAASGAAAHSSSSAPQ